MRFKNRQEAAEANAAALARGRKIAERAEHEGRSLTADERAAIRGHVEEAKAAANAAAAFDGDQVVLDSLSALHRGNGGSKGRQRGDGSWANAMDDFLGRHQFKELVPTGTITVPALSAGIITETDRPRSILQLVPFVPLEGTDQFSYIKETLRQPAASTVRPGLLKPTSVFNLARVDDRARTIATLSEPINRKDLLDVQMLRDYLESSLRVAVELALEDQVLAGDGDTSTDVLDNLLGILETPLTQAQPFDTDRLVTTRKAVTLLENIHIDPNGLAWVMSPADWEDFELMTSTSHFLLADPGQAGTSLPVDRARRRLWGIPLTTSTAMPEGTALLGDFKGSVVVREREQVNISWSEATTVDGNTGFETNTVRFRAEGRWGLAVLKPPAFVEVDLVAGS
jgi:HK97 family phage major capsid protein